MTGALPYVNIEEAVETTLNELESWLSTYFELDGEAWRVTFEETGTIAIGEPTHDILDISVVGQLIENVPAEYALDSGEIRTPIFPVGGSDNREDIRPEETEGYRKVLSQIVVEVEDIAEVPSSTDDFLEDIVDQHKSRGIVDAFGEAWSDRDSLLASEAAKRSLSVTEPSAVISFGVLRRLIYAFQYEDYIKYDQHEEGELVREDKVSFGKIIEAEQISEDQLPVVTKVYVHQGKRVAASDYQISSRQIAQSIRGKIIGWDEACTVPDPSKRGLRARIGSIAKIVLDDDQEMYQGFVRVSNDADISLVYDFYAALHVPGHPYITYELAQETPDWDEDSRYFGGWSAADDGFVYRSYDDRREIRRRLYASKYWVIQGENHRRKSEFVEDVEVLIEMAESELGCEVTWREFGETRVSKTPITQSEVLDQIREEVRAPPEYDDIIQAIGGIPRQSEDIDGINRPLFPSDLSEFVADTSIVDAQVITRLIAEGDLYHSAIIVPDVVIEEIHRQVEDDTSRGKQGLEELEALRELSTADIVDLEIIDVELQVDTEDNVAVDQNLIRIARDRKVPLCSADKTLLRFAEAAGVTAYPLEQELSRWSRLIMNVLRESGELHVADLIREVYSRIEENRVSEEAVRTALFQTPDRVPQEDMGKEMAIREELNQLERRGDVYRQEDQVGLIREVAVVPSLDALENGLLSDKIIDNELIDSIGLPAFKVRVTVFLPDSFEHWASWQDDSGYLSEMRALENLQGANELQLNWVNVLPVQTGVLMADEEQFSNLFQGLQREVSSDYEYTRVIDTGSGSLMLSSDIPPKTG